MNRVIRQAMSFVMLVLVMIAMFGHQALSAASMSAGTATGGHSFLTGMGCLVLGMALSLVDPNLAWQSVTIALANANPGIQAQFRALKSYLSQHRGSRKLQFKPFTEADADAAGGTVVLDAAHTLHGAYTKKENSATDNWTWIYDDATNDTTAAKARVCLPQLIASEEQCWIHPQGLPMGTGLTITQYATDALGAVDGSNGAAGFVLVSAA